MSLSEGSGVSSSPESLALGQIFSFFGDVADYAAGAAAVNGERVARLAVAMARLGGFSGEETAALFFAARLRNAGAFGNPAFIKGSSLSEREARMARWDVPAMGARICERLAALPPLTADIVRWQAERWDGTGYPDQLRWAGIPRAAQLLQIAAEYVAATDPEEALAAISGGAGQAYAPEQARTFVMWFHTFGGNIEPVESPYDALDVERGTVADLIALLSERIDTHNGTPGRGARIALYAQGIAAELGMDEDAVRDAGSAALLYGIGKLREPQTESEFDPLSRLGIEARARNAVTAASFLESSPVVAAVAPIVRSRAEWYDGTGAPEGLRQGAIPPLAHALALAIAYESMEASATSRITEQRTLPIARLETAAGTQFDPVFVRALSAALKARA